MVSPARIKTNNLLAKAFDLNDFLDPTRLAHDELQYYNDLTRAFDKIISHHIDWLDSPEAKKIFYEEIKNREEYFQAIDGDLDDIIQDTSLSADRIIEKVYRKGLNYGYKDINRLPVFNDSCKYGLKATQEYNFELIQSVSNDLKDSIRHHIFRGIAEGQSIHEVARAITDSGLKPIEGKTLSAYQRASLIARTEIARSMTTGRLQSYANYGVEKVKILTAGDDNVCPICRKAEKKIYTLEKAANLIPFHPACRCSVIAHIEHYPDIPQKPIENPRFMDCSPNDTILLPRTSWTKREIHDSLKGHVDDKDLNLIVDHVFQFIMGAEEYPYIECGASFDKEFKPINKFIKGGIKGVSIPDNERGFGLTIHSHTSGRPFPSLGDLNTILNLNSKYNIIYTPVGLVIVTNHLKSKASIYEEGCHEYKSKSNEINNDIDEKINQFIDESEKELFPDKYVKNKKKEFVRKNADRFTNLLDELIDNEILEIEFMGP